MSKFLSEVKGFTPVIDILAQELGLMAAVVYGIVWRYCQMEDHVCTASLDRIAEHANISRRTVERHIKDLCDAGYLEDRTPGKRHRPHIYADTGRAKITGLLTVEISTTESPENTTENTTSTTESRTQYDRESHKESLYDSIYESKEGEKEGDSPSEKPDALMQDLARITEEKQAEKGNYATPAHAGGSDIAASCAYSLFCEMQEQMPTAKEREAMILELSETLKPTSTSIEEIEAAFEIMAKDFQYRTGNYNVFQSSFKQDLRTCIARARGQATQRTAPRHQPESALLSQEALQERQAAGPPPPEDDAVGQGVKAQLELQMGRPEFQRLVRPTRFTCEDGVLVITAPDDFTRNWLENRVAVTIERALAGMADGPREVRFEVEDDLQTASAGT